MLQEIRVRIGESNKPQIEDISEMLDTSIFSNQYTFALSAIDYHISAANGKSINDRVVSQVDGDNNIFAFIGDRGTGKTSCMMSIVKYLTSNNINNNYRSIKNKHFVSTELIDPAFFDEKHNIVSMFLAKLYNLYLAWSDESCSARTGEFREKERKLIEAFYNAQRYLNYILYFNPEDNSEQLEDLQQLSLMSSAIELRKCIKELVSLFFEVTEGKTDCILLLPIDDIDLNTDGAERMSEQIRKYLIHENIIIVMSLKLDQLAQIKRGKFLATYEKQIGNNYVTNEEIDQMVEKYMVKFIPQGHRVYMPDSSYYINAKIRLVVNGHDELLSSSPLMTYIPEQIFLKTRYLFYNSHQRLSYIIPLNLRELIQMVTLLYNMEDFRNDQIKNAYNQTLLKKYIFEDWVDANLSISDRKLAREIYSISDYSNINKRTVSILTNRFAIKDEKFAESLVSPKEASRIDEKNILIKGNSINYNVSFGDVLSFVDMIERLSSKEDDLRFLFIIKTIYSIRLYEAYNDVTEFDNSLRTEDMLGKKNEGLSLLNSYEKFVGGRFVNPRLYDVLPYDATSRISRSDRIIKFDVLRALISECAAYTTANEIQANKDKIRLAEFFMLCTLRDVDTKNFRVYDKDYRERRTINYADSLERKKTNAFFDVNAFLFNITRIKECYGRFKDGNKLYDNLENNDSTQSSFWGCFKKATLDLRPDQTSNGTIFNQNAWLSACCLRNFEIIQDLYDTIANDSNYEGTDHQCLARFFSRIGDYSIKTYDTSHDGTRLHIDFRFVNYVAEWLASLSGEGSESLLSLFNAIYNQSDFEEENEVIENSQDTNIRQVDIETFMSRRNGRDSKKDNVRTGLYKQYPFLKFVAEYNNRMKEILRPYEAVMQPPQIVQALQQINEMILQLNGQH